MNICTYDESCAREMQLGMECAARVLNLIWNIREIFPKKGTFKLRTER